MAPIDRIKQALKDEAQRARFDRFLDDMAHVLVPALTGKGNTTPIFAPRVHDGNLVEIEVTEQRTIR